MGHLAFLGSHKVNGVSQLHTELVKETRVPGSSTASIPDRIVNKTNGITFRRWLLEANPALTKLLGETIGPEFHGRPEALRDLEKFADDASFQQRYAAHARHEQGSACQDHLRPASAIKVDPAALFDVQIKRIHEYKRQLLNVLQTIALYNEIRAQPTRDFVPRVKIFAGKAAASYHQAKLIIKLINDVAPGGQQRPRRPRAAEGRLPAELQCEPRRDRSFPRPISPSRSRPRAWRPRAPAT